MIRLALFALIATVLTLAPATPARSELEPAPAATRTIEEWVPPARVDDPAEVPLPGAFLHRGDAPRAA